MRVGLVRLGGEWRIDSLPPGVVIERSAFFSGFVRRDLFFLDRSGRKVVPDPRWTTAYPGDLESSLVNLLAEGMRPELEGGARTAFPAPSTVSVRAAARDADHVAGTLVDFQGLKAMSTQETTQFVAQVVWTLDRAKVPGPYRIERDGTPLDERHSDGWRLEDVASFGPTDRVDDLGFALTPADGLVRLDPTGAAPAGGAWSSLRQGRSAAQSWDSRLLAAVTDPDGGAPATLLVGPVTGGPQPVLRGGSVSTPTWDSTDGSVWVVVDGDRVVRVSDPVGRSRTDDLDTTELRALPGPLTDLRLDDTGTRALVVAGSRAYVGVVSSGEGRRPRVTSLRRIGQSFGDTVSSVAWRDRATAVLGRDSPTAPTVVSITTDGAWNEPLSIRNITAPVSALAVTGARVSAVDGRSLVTTDTALDLPAQFWQDQPGLAAIRAFPVAPG